MRVGFDKPEIMNDPAERAEVYESMQFRPCLSPEPSRHSIRGSRRERYQQKKARKSHCNKGPFGDVRQNFLPEEELIQIDICEEVKGNGKESKQSEHATDLKQPVPTGELSERCNGQGYHEESERPGASGIRDIINRIGAQRPVVRIPSQDYKRRKAQKEDDRFENKANALGCGQDREEGYEENFECRIANVELTRLT